MQRIQPAEAVDEELNGRGTGIEVDGREDEPRDDPEELNGRAALFVQDPQDGKEGIASPRSAGAMPNAMKC